MIKINNVLILSLSLVMPAISLSSPFTDNAARYGRAAAFHASRFLAGRLVYKAVGVVSQTASPVVNKLVAPIGFDGRLVWDAGLFTAYASAAMAPNALNKIAINAKTP